LASESKQPALEPSTETAQVDDEQLFRLMIANVRDYAIFMLTPSGHIATWNLGAERIKGYKADEIIGKHFSTFYPEIDVQSGKCEHELEVATAEGRFEDLGWRVRKDGSQFWANVVITAVRNESGQLVGFSKVTRDLSDRKRAEDETIGRLEAEERYRYLVESVADYAIFMLDATGHVATWNIGAARIKGYTANEIIGSHFSRFYMDEDIRAGKCELELRVATRDGRFEDEGWRLRKDGSRFWANVVISAVRDANGALVGFSKVTRDLTERKKSEEERAARLAAEQANRAKDEFLAMLGHELRNPLAPILTALQLLKLRGDNLPLKEHEIIERQVRHMMHLVDDLLDVARITKGKVEIKRKPLDLRVALAKAIEIASPLIEQRQHELVLDVPNHALGVEGDEGRLIQVIANLLTNAAKYTEPSGHISIVVSDTKNEIKLSVTDNGSGIDSALLPNIFQLFVQGARASDRSGGGLGIGLTLVSKLTELHGGRVEAQSAGLGKGSTFTIWLPGMQLPRPEAEAAAAARASKIMAAANPRRILIVDDNEDALVLLAEALQHAGHDVRTATDPAQALEVIKDFKPELAILDIGLPVMDGYELATRIREQLDTGSPRMFALSGYGQQADRDRSHQAGFSAHFVKPVDVKQLIERIASADVSAVTTPSR
jgi:PAS domain S-box-containing protein